MVLPGRGPVMVHAVEHDVAGRPAKRLSLSDRLLVDLTVHHYHHQARDPEGDARADHSVRPVHHKGADLQRHGHAVSLYDPLQFYLSPFSPDRYGDFAPPARRTKGHFETELTIDGMSEIRRGKLTNQTANICTNLKCVRLAKHSLKFFEFFLTTKLTPCLAIFFSISRNKRYLLGL